MARTKRNHQDNKPSCSKSIYKVAAYIRLSREDGDKVESDSIVNQKMKLGDYINNIADFSLYDFYIDDGYTGTNFERTDFKRMINDIFEKKINCVVVKDLSRFGRDYIGVGEYLEKVFPNNNIRFIAIDDNIDSFKNAYDMMLPVRNVFNEQYATDISKKVQSAFKTKQKNGSFIGAFASYGYKKNPNNHNELVIDEYPASIVQRIFQMFLDGYGKIKIAKILNEEGVLGPSAYKTMCGQNYTNGQSLQSTVYWTYSTIHKILNHEIYIGNMVQGKTIRQNLKSKARMLPEDKWIVVEGTHEPIIEKYVWDNVQVLLKKDTRQIDFNQNISLFSGFLVCGDCGRAMAKQSRKNKEGEISISYRCGTYQRYGTQFCSPHTIKQSMLEEIILGDLNRIIQQIKDISVLAQKVERLNSKLSTNFQSEIEKLRQSLSRVQKLKKGIYEDFKDEIISLDDYKSLKLDYEAQETSLKNTIKSLEDSSKNKPFDILNKPWVKSLIEKKEITKIDRVILAEMVDKISIYNDNVIEITYKYDSEVKEFGNLLM